MHKGKTQLLPCFHQTSPNSSSPASPTELFAHAPTRQQQPASSQRQSAAPSMQAARDQAAAGTEEKGGVEPAGGGVKA